MLLIIVSPKSVLSLYNKMKNLIEKSMKYSSMKISLIIVVDLSEQLKRQKQTESKHWQSNRRN